MKHRRLWLSSPPPAKRRRGLPHFRPAKRRRGLGPPSFPAKRRRGLDPPSFPAKQRRGVSPPPVFKCGNVEQGLLLFETPSGFAIFRFCASLFDEPDAMEFLWAEFAENWNSNSFVSLHHFQTFEDKSSAINEKTGVNERLVEMIMKWHCPGMKMAVGKPEYKKIIEDKLGIQCLYGPIAMELMWGIQKLMPSSVPEEKSPLSEEDRLPLSQGLKKFLRSNDCDVKPEMVNDKIIKTAAYLFFECDSIEKDHSVALRKAGDHLKNISGISCEDWSLLKIATALKFICWPEEGDNSCQMIPQRVVSKLLNDAPLYQNVLDPDSCVGIYNHMMYAHKVRIEKKKTVEIIDRGG